jgi:hypothetical protein
MLRPALQLLIFLFILLLNVAVLRGQPSSGTIHGKVFDVHGDLVAGATVTAIGIASTRITSTNAAGEFDLVLQPGVWKLEVKARGFGRYEEQVQVIASTAAVVDVVLTVEGTTENVIVPNDSSIDTDPNSEAGAVVLKKNELKSLPDDPAELQAALQALAGPGSGPDGGEVFIDGFSGGKLPKKETIREVRINQNPFSSENDRPGFGRIEILTKPGTEDWHAELQGEFEDEALNSRNPYSPNRPPFQLRNFNGEVSGPLIKNRLSLFTDLEREAIDNNTLVNALVLDSSLNVVPFVHSFVTPTVNWDFGQRLDWQINSKHTLVSRFSRETFRSINSGFGGYALLSQAQSSKNSESFIRLTETAILSPTVVNETRFQFLSSGERSSSVDNSPTVQVLDSFLGGGGGLGNSLNQQGRHEFTNITSVVKGRNIIRAGARLRYQSVDDISPVNFSGTFIFTSLERYRDTILNLPGAHPTQFSIAGGDPHAKVSRWDAGLFFQNDVQLRPDVTMSFGVRYERQTHVRGLGDIAPRAAIAWALPSRNKTSPVMVVRAGFGIFYDRFGTNLTLRTLRFNGISQQSYIVTDPAILDPIIFTTSGVANIPSTITLAAFAQPLTTRVVDQALRAPRTVQLGLSIERKLSDTTLTLSFIHSRTFRMLRSRNVNAPLNGIRPNLGMGNVFEYESTGRFVQNQIVLNFHGKAGKRISFFGNYSAGFARSDTEGANSFPADSNNLKAEYSRSASDIRHRFTAGGDVRGPFGLEISPFVSYRSGVPFNITAGTDVNGDTSYNDRPSFAAAGEAGAIVTTFGTFDPTPETGDVVIPRNYGRGPQFFQPNLQISKVLSYGIGSNGPGDDDDENEGKYQLELSVQIRNLFNRNNRGVPVGNVTSPFFGRSLSTAAGSAAVGNRRIRLELTFSF